MIFNGTDFTEYMRILSINKSLLPDILTFDRKNAGQDGLYPTRKSELKEYFIDIEIELKNNGVGSKEDFFREMAKKLFTKTEAKLILKREANRYYEAKLVGSTDLKVVHEYGVAKLTFQATTPFALSLVEKTKNLNTVFINEGTYESFGIISLTAPTANNVTVSNGEKTLKLLYPFTGTQKIVINLEQQYVTMNGANAMKYISLESDFFTIPSGSTNITSNGTGTIKYRERWL